MASSSNNQEIRSFKLMDSLYSAAADGDIKEFQKHSNRLDHILTPNGNTILHIYITAQQRTGIFMSFLGDILEMCSDLLWKANNKGETLLHMAARHGHADVAKFLLQECKKPFQNDQELGIKATRRMLQMTNEAKDTALHEAVRYDHLDVVEVLAVEDRELPYDANAAGETPLYLAAERGYAEVLGEILKTCNSPADHGPYDRTALHVAVIRNDKDIVKRILFQTGEKIQKSKQDRQGWTPLHFAAHLGYIKILKMLLIVDESAAYVADNEGKTALHVAAGFGRVGIMRELISICPGCCEPVDKRGRNVLHFAFESKNRRAVELILENSWLRNLINEKDENGNTPFLHAASMSYCYIAHPRVDKQVFNNHNHNAADIVSANGPISEWFPDLFLWVLKCYEVKQGLRMIVSENDNNGEGKDEGNTVKSKSKEDVGGEDEGNRMSSKSNNGKGKNISISNLMKKSRQNELVAATLIATVTFAAGFTVPGGFVADKGPDQGAAVLTRNTAFRAFVILNTMSMFFSCLAVILHLNDSSDIKKIRLRQLLLGYAMCAMIGAFLSGTWAVLHNDRNLAITAFVVPVAMYATFQTFLLISNKIESLLKFVWKMEERDNFGEKMVQIFVNFIVKKEFISNLSWFM